MKIFVFLVLLAGSISLIGCGGGSSAINEPVISRVSIATFPGNSSGGTGPLTSSGGHVELQLTLTSTSAIDANSVLFNVVDAAGTSVLGGPQHMGQLMNGSATPNPSAFSYAFNLPANTSHPSQVYTLTVIGADTAGHKIITPASIGTLTVPGI